MGECQCLFDLFVQLDSYVIYIVSRWNFWANKDGWMDRLVMIIAPSAEEAGENEGKGQEAKFYNLISS